MRYCAYYQRTPVPADQDTIIGYITFLARSISANSIPGYLNIISLLSSAAGLPNPLAKNWEVNVLKRAISRLKGVPPVQKEPITIDMLLQMHKLLNFKTTNDCCFWLACLVAFYGFFRKSTLLLKNDKTKTSEGICIKDISIISDDAFCISIRHSKTIQFGQRVLRVPFSRCTVRNLCPVRALFNHLSINKMSADCALFSYKAGSVIKILTQSHFASRVKSLLNQSGFDSQLISCHSFRRGGTSFAISCGLNPLQVKARGDWKSNAFEKYVFISDNSFLLTSTALSDGVSKSVKQKH